MYNDLYLNSIISYTDFLIKMSFDIDEICNNINNLDDVYEKKQLAQDQLKKLESLSQNCKLYDKDYKDFTIAMGIFILSINKCPDLNISDKNSDNFIYDFICMNDTFEELIQNNLIKDAYSW